MTSACTLRNKTRVFLKFTDFISEICLDLINSNFTSYFLPSSVRSSGAGTSKEIPLKNSEVSLPAILIFFLFSFLKLGSSIKSLFNFIHYKSTCHPIFLSIRWTLICSFVEQVSNGPSLQRNNSPNILNSTQISHIHTTGMPSVSSIASPQPQILTINDNSNEPTMPYGFGRQLPVVPLSLDDLNLPPNPFNILATMAIVNHTEDDNDDKYSPQSPEPYELSPILTPPMNVSTFDNWETSHTTTDDNTLYSDDEPRRKIFLPSTPTPPPQP